MNDKEAPEIATTVIGSDKGEPLRCPVCDSSWKRVVLKHFVDAHEAYFACSHCATSLRTRIVVKKTLIKGVGKTVSELIFEPLDEAQLCAVPEMLRAELKLASSAAQRKLA